MDNFEWYTKRDLIAGIYHWCTFQKLYFLRNILADGLSPDVILHEKKEMKQYLSATSFSCDGVNGAKGYILL